LRSVMLFSLAAFSIAKAATCTDFKIYANDDLVDTPSGNSIVNYSIDIGKKLEFEVKPASDTILWSREINGILTPIPITGVSKYSPPIDIVTTGNSEQTMVIIVKNCGVEKTIKLKLNEIPYTVAFDTDGGTPVDTQYIMPRTTTVTKPQDPTKNGYDFVKWEWPVGTEYTFSTNPTDNMTIKAKWKPITYTITFNPGQDGNVSPPTQSVTYDALVGTLPTPTRDGYEFIGWFDMTGYEYKPTTYYNRVNDNITLSAKWKPIEYPIDFDLNLLGCADGTVKPASISVAYNEPIGNLPNPRRDTHRLVGWFLADGTTEYKSTTIYPTKGPTTLYAKWEFIPGQRPTVNLLDTLNKIPRGLVYNGNPIADIRIMQKPGDCGGKINDEDITVYYDKEIQPPKDAGTYAITVFINKNITGDYDTATVSLGPMTIGKAPATASVSSITVKPKEYDADSLAEIGDVRLNISPLYGSDQVSPGDYIINAYFNSSNVVDAKIVEVTINWHPNGPLSKNYTISPSPLIYSKAATITQATGELRIRKESPYDLDTPPFYKYISSEEYPAVDKNSFIPDSVIKFDYKRETEKDEAYTEKRPNGVGRWWVRATLPSTTNYKGAQDSILFMVERGNARPVKHEIEISDDHFTRDPDLSGELREYYVGDVCDSEREDSIKITILGEPDVVLDLAMASVWRMDENLNYYYKVPFNFNKSGASKPGLDTLIYKLASIDNLYEEHDTLFIEVPITFDSIAKQKWNNVLLINNNPKDNGGYEFKDFKWFKNGKVIDSLQFYSAGPRSTDVLKQSDVYKVTMHTKDGIRISTCEGNPKKINIPVVVMEKPNVTKQVLGINGKTAKPEQKVYNASGAERKNTPAGVYIIKDK